MPWQLQKHGKLSHLARVNTRADLWFIDAWVPILFERGSYFCWCVQQKSLVYQADSGIFVYENALSCVFWSSNSLSIHDSFQPGAKESSKQRSAQHSACCWRQTSRKSKFFDRTHVNKLVSLTQKITKSPSVWTWFTCVHVVCVDVYDKHGYFFPKQLVVMFCERAEQPMPRSGGRKCTAHLTWTTHSISSR